VWHVEHGTSPNLREKLGMAVASRTAITTLNARNKATIFTNFVTHSSYKRPNTWTVL
jgi:hypothetical protein